MAATPRLIVRLLPILFLCIASESSADLLKCQRIVLSESTNFLRARAKVLAKCEVLRTAGKLPGATTCTTEPKTAASLAKAATKLEAAIGKACGGEDGVCGGDLAGETGGTALGWPAVCPDFERVGCANAIGTTSCTGITDCLACIGGLAVDQAIGLYSENLTRDPAAVLNKCEQTIVRAAAKFFDAESQILKKCWDARLAGKHTGSCVPPAAGDGKYLTALAKAESKKVAAICKACGGGACDTSIDTSLIVANGAVVSGTPGTADFTVAEIGFADQCSEVVLPNAPGTACGVLDGVDGADDAIETLRELILCADCVTVFKVACATSAALPGLTAYPPQCNLEPGTEYCGDGFVNQPSEQCDGSNDGACPGACRFDCVCGPRCGDGTINQVSETCDGTAVGGDTCTAHGFAHGTLRCEADCTGIDLTSCSAPVCGDNQAVAGEPCDGTALRGATCASLGFTGGTLVCLPGCQGLDSRGCTLPVAPPNDPTIGAPDLDRSVATDVGSTTEFLYTGPDRVQYGVGEGTIRPQHAAVLSGVVTDRNLVALPSVEIRVEGHPEYGVAVSRVDGGYDLAVNGGGALSLNFAKPGYLRAQRQVQVPWQDYVAVPGVALVEKDPVATPIDLTAAVPMQIAQGSSVTDSAGTRHAVVMIPQGTQAEVILANGSTQLVTNLTLRLTEYTVGPNGPAAMPGELPPTSGYTYAVELGVDEAVAKVAGKDVLLSQSVPVYVENFLGMPVGIQVPAAYYDDNATAWVPIDDGRVIKILSVSSGAANLDTNGDAIADSPAQLSALGITTAEREALALTYSAGQTLWRIRVNHFSTYDLNYGTSCKPGQVCESPNQPPGDPDPCSPDTKESSLIECQSQILGEELSLTGSPFTIHYTTDRVPGRLPTLNIPLSGSTLPAGLQRIDLRVYVAGSVAVSQSFTPATNLSHRFVWNGRDRFGRLVQGRQTATIYLTYVYDGVYNLPPSYSRTFGGAGGWGNPIPGNIPARLGVFRTQTQAIPIEGSQWDIRTLGLGGWSLSVHHLYDPIGKTLYEGTGKRRGADAAGVINAVVTRVAGGGSGGDGSEALNASIETSGIAVAADGTIYASDWYSGKIWRIGTDGFATVIAGGNGPGYSGDGGPAAQARLQWAFDLDVGPDGSLYILQGGPVGGARPAQVRRISPDGIISTVAGTTVEGFSGDGGPATAAQFRDTWGIGVGPDGSLYVADTGNHRVRRIGPDGVIRTVAGNGTAGFSGDGGLSTLAAVHWPRDVAVGPNGDLFIAALGQGRLRRVRPDGIISTFAGTGTWGYNGDDKPATQAQVNLPSRLAVGKDGSVYLAEEGAARYRRVIPDGTMQTVVGTGTPGFPLEGSPSTQSRVDYASSLALLPNGDLLYGSGTATGPAMFRRSAPFPGYTATAIQIPSTDGLQLYEFNSRGRHLRTLNTLTGATLYTFNYDGAGRLSEVVDGDGNVTTVEHDGAGNPTAIVAPFGQRTTLAVNGGGYLGTVTNPAGEAYQFVYSAAGLLQSMTTPRTFTTNYTYDSLGRLASSSDPGGGSQTLGRTEFRTFGLINQSGYEVTHTTGLGRITRYKYESGVSGPLVRSFLAYLLTNTNPDGTVERTWQRRDGVTEHLSPDGTVATSTQSADPRFGVRAPVLTQRDVLTPGGLHLTEQQTRTATLAQPGNPLSLSNLTETRVVNGRTFATSYDAVTRTYTDVTPEGRQQTRTIDAQGRVLRSEVPGFFPVDFSYDSRGRLEQMTQGTGVERRVTNFAFAPSGYLDAVTDPLARTVAFDYDAAGRVSRQELPGVGSPRDVLFGYDPSGNLSSLTPPGRPAHTFDYTPINLKSLYTPPDVGLPTHATQYAYNSDRQPTVVTRPDGLTITYAYDSAGRVATITAPHGVTTYTYDAAGRVASIVAPGPETLTYTYDGSLLTRTEWGGTVNGSVERSYDNDLRLKTISVNGQDPVTYSYDNDGLVVQAGAMTITRSPQNGLVTSTTLANVTDSYEYNGFGEMTRYTARFNATVLYDLGLTRDPLGRISEKRETIEGVQHIYGYEYDDAGRLFHVITDGAQTAEYTYDANGNRVTAPGLSIAPLYDDQDRLLSYNGAAYTYTATGELLTKSDASGTTRYDYDAFGGLREIDRPGSVNVSYVVDGTGARIGRRENATLTQGILYQGRLSPSAIIAPTGEVVSRFIYGMFTQVPLYVLDRGVSYRIITDYLGSPRLLVDSSTGAIARKVRHSEFGVVLADDNPGTIGTLGFAGGLQDSAVPLLRFGARDYDVAVGRWTVIDPVVFGGGVGSLYSYADNDPVNLVDRTGFSPENPDACFRNCLKTCGASAIPIIIGSATGGAFVKFGAKAAAKTALACIVSPLDDLAGAATCAPICAGACSDPGKGPHLPPDLMLQPTEPDPLRPWKNPYQR